MKIDVLCIGTPKIIGDAVGPLVGTRLEAIRSALKHDVQIIGTMEDPVVRSNYNEKLKMLRPGATIVVVDATIGKKVGEWELAKGPTYPGSGVNKNVGAVGDISIKCFTADNPQDLLRVSNRMVQRLSRDIATKLLVLINTNKIKRYIDAN